MADAVMYSQYRDREALKALSLVFEIGVANAPAKGTAEWTMLKPIRRRRQYKQDGAEGVARTAADLLEVLISIQENQ